METPETNSDNLAPEIRHAAQQTLFLHRYMMAVDHALLWVAALSFAAYFHLSPAFTKSQALLLSTLVAYGAYLCESGLETLKVVLAAPFCTFEYRKAGLWSWIGLNIMVNAVLSLLFLRDPSWVYLLLIIFTAGWQKYMDGRIPPRLQATRRNILNHEYPA